MSSISEKKKTSLSAGLFWSSVAVVFGKVCTLLSQVVGGSFLSASDYGVIAFATSVLSVLALFYNYGLDNYLIQKHKEWPTLLPTIWKIAHATTVFSIILGIFTALFYALKGNESSSFWLILVGVASFPFASFLALYRAEHAVEGNYIYQSLNNAANSIVNMLLFIVLLLLGVGPVSFFWGQLFGNIASYVFFRRGTPRINTSKKGALNYVLLKKVFWDLWSVSLGNIFNSLALRIDYLVLGVIATNAALGYYFFGFSLTGVLALLFTAGIQGVLMPDLVHKFSSRERFKDTLASIEFHSLYIGGFLSACFLFALPDFLYMVWNTRWDDACFVALVLCLVLPIAICRANMLVALDAAGKWTEKALLNGVNFVTVGLAAWAGWRWGELVGVTIAVSLQRLLFGLLAISFVNVKLLSISVWTNLLRMGQYSLPFVAISIAGWAFGYVEFAEYSAPRGLLPFLSKVPSIALFFAAYVALGYLVAPNYLKSAFSKIRGFRKPCVTNKG